MYTRIEYLDDLISKAVDNDNTQLLANSLLHVGKRLHFDTLRSTTVIRNNNGRDDYITTEKAINKIEDDSQYKYRVNDTLWNIFTFSSGSPEEAPKLAGL